MMDAFSIRDQWWHLPLALRQRWWRETDYGKTAPSEELRREIETIAHSQHQPAEAAE